MQLVAVAVVLLSILSLSSAARPLSREFSAVAGYNEVASGLPSRHLLAAKVQNWGFPNDANPPLVQFPNIAAQIGDTVTFRWNGTRMHGLWQIPASVCPAIFNASAPGYRQLVASTNNATITIRMNTPGTIYFACPVPGHCSLGMIVGVVVAAPDVGYLPAAIDVPLFVPNASAPAPEPLPGSMATPGTEG